MDIMTMASLTGKIDAIKAALASTSTCTTATIVGVKELLLPDIDIQSTNSKAAPKTGRSKTTSKTKGTSTSRTTSSTSTGKSKPGLDVKEKAALATNVINLAIKALNEATKPTVPQTPCKKQPSTSDLRKTAGSRTLRRSLSAPLSPIQPRTLNRVATSPNLAAKAANSPPLSQSTGCLATVECARAAFACLRSIKEPIRASEADFQLESAMSTFVGKLMALGFQEQAWAELRILKRRLDVALSLETSKSSSLKQLEPTTGIQLVAELLTYEKTIPDCCLPIITACQVQVLRLISMSKKPGQIEAVLPFLLESSPSSPLSLLFRLSASNDKEGQKAIRQLASLSHIILALAPSVSSKEDHIATEPRLSPSPQTAFDLQASCFKTQLRWWKLAGHRGNVDDDVLSPFSRCIRALLRRHNLENGSIYTTITQQFNDIMVLVQTQASQPEKSSGSPLASIYQLLGTAAYSERNYAQAQRWFEDLKDLFRPDQDAPVRVCSISARLLAAALKKTPIDSTADQLVQEVVEGLDGCLSGSVSELNELMEGLSLARRSAVSLLGNKINSKNAGSSPLEDLLESLKTFVLRYPRFVRRWLGAPPAKEASAKHLLQFDQRRLVVMQSINQVLDSALMVVNLGIQGSTMTWQLIDEILQDCVKLLITIEDPTLSPGRIEQLGAYHVKISNLYFIKFSQLRKDLGQSKELNKQILQTLNRSIDTVKDRSIAQQEKAQLATKLEVFADLCKGAGRSHDAVRSLRSICTNMIEEGALLKVTAALATQSPTLAWSVDEKAETLSRTLKSIAKLDKSWNDWAFFLPEAERAAVLEHLMQVSAEASARSQPLRLHDPSVEALLRLYSLDRFPIRRLRVILHLFSQNLGDAILVDDIRSQAEEAVQHVNKQLLGEDGSLSRYVTHLKAYHSSLMALASTEVSFSIATMKEAVLTWTAIIESCNGRSSLSEKIDNPDGLLAHLQSASQFASLRGENSLQLSILELSAALSKVLAESTYDKVVLNNTLLASQYLVVGHFSEARKMLDATKDVLENTGGVSRGLVAGFHLSQAEYYAGIGSIDEANSSLLLAKTICDEPTSAWALSKSEATVVISLASLLDSIMALKQGRVQESLSCVKSCVRQLSHDWSKIESSSRASSPSELNSSTSSISDLKETAATYVVIGPRFWSLAFPLLRGLLHISSVYAHLGMFQETIYYAESAQKVAESTGSSLYKAQVLAWTGSVYRRAGKLEKALQFGNKASEYMPAATCAARAQLACQLSDLYQDVGEEKKAAELLKLAEETTQLLSNHGKPSKPSESDDKPATAIKGRGKPASRTTRTTRTTRAKAATAPKAAPRSQKRAPAAQKGPAKGMVNLPKDIYQASLMASILISRTLGFIYQRDWASALSTLELAKDLPKLFETLSQEQMMTAISLIGHSMEQMIQDPVFSVVQDSTISFPAISGSSDKGRLSFSITSPKKSRAVGAAADRKGSGGPSFVDALKQAQELLLEAHASTLSTANSTMVHRISALLQTTVILLSATTTTKSKAVASSGFATFSVDLARNITWKREQSTLQTPQNLAQVEDPVAQLATDVSKRLSLGLTTEMAKFQRKYIELVPKTWSVISISLSDNHHDLCITKFQAGHSPFILRLPLERANSRDADSEVFNFEHGREEMMDIIRLANETSHSANRDFSAKGARTAWWAEREALDNRLQELLSTIETTWLGGFKGIFSQHERRLDLLARFQKSFQQILDSSLPSRNRMRGKKTTKTPKITLDPRILDLFIGLGDPNDPDSDFDEALNDLLYFVVDILQFHGERNAYDEIDFDAMVVETYDALRGYYAAARGSERAEGAHTVLVLDKALHAFPWESMPCMDSLAVSRVPSLASLRQLILQSQKPSAKSGGDENMPEGHYISATKGTYILNPSTDLKNTQKSFDATLSTLTSWTGIVSRAPQEAEFEKALSTSDILLYFGHGSGGQYIRARTIRRLEKCRPATFLMGCSSASLTEAGEFECYGPVWNYMMAGCPAVVGTLWDVTDRDIDRFAERTFEEWGLFPRGTFKDQKGKGRSKVDVDGEHGDGEVVQEVSLVEAVARSRGACRFKYLNAAAVVLYGIPVYINREE